MIEMSMTMCLELLCIVDAVFVFVGGIYYPQVVDTERGVVVQTFGLLGVVQRQLNVLAIVN